MLCICKNYELADGIEIESLSLPGNFRSVGQFWDSGVKGAARAVYSMLWSYLPDDELADRVVRFIKSIGGAASAWMPTASNLPPACPRWRPARSSLPWQANAPFKTIFQSGGPKWQSLFRTCRLRSRQERPVRSCACYDEETGFYTTLFDNDEQSIAEVEGEPWYSEAEVFEIYAEDPNVYDPSLTSAHDPRVVIELDSDYFL